MKPVLLVSDLHLAPSRPAIGELFFRFLREQAREASALYILGDLFEYWIGDDDIGARFNEQILAAIRALGEAGVPVNFMPGNRDFLLGATAAERARMTLLADPTVADLCGQRTLLMHGDSLCTDDTNYQAYRRRVHSPRLQRLYAALPLSARRGIARYARYRSAHAKQDKPAAIMDVNAQAVAAAFRAAQCTRMIHGHTHRPARHEHVVDGVRCERWVLADWYASGSFLRVTADSVASVPLG